MEDGRTPPASTYGDCMLVLYLLAAYRPMKMQKRIPWLVLLALGIAASTAGADPLDTKPLVEIAQQHGLPMPPSDATLVLANTGGTLCLGNRSTSRDPAIFFPAYILETKPDGSIVILRGTETLTLSPRNNGEPLWRPFSAEEVVPKAGGYAVDFSMLSAFVCSVQAAALGDENSAQQIWQRFSVKGMWNWPRIAESPLPNPWTYHPHTAKNPASQQPDPKDLLAACLFERLWGSLRQEQPDLKDIRSQMEALFTEFPRMNRGGSGELFRDLTTTINAKPAKPGSVEALLLDWACRPVNHLGIFQDVPNSDANIPAQEIALRGRAAIPKLMALMDDRRVTTHSGGGFMMAPLRIKRLGELACELVREIAGTPASFPLNGEDKPADIRAWWDKAAKLDEVDLLTKGVFRKEKGKIVWVNKGPVRILALKYPEKLVGLCEEFTKHAAADAQPFALAEALAGSSLPRETRVRVLAAFAQRGSPEDRRCVLQVLAKLDQQTCADILLPVLKSSPKDVKGPYWTCPQASMTHVVMEIENDDVWHEYLRAAKRSSVGLRMEMMNAMNYSYIGQKNRGRRLAFLAAFLDDDAVRELPADPWKQGRFDGPCAAFTFPRIRGGDFAAMQIASILGLKESPDEVWTNARWEHLRSNVRAELAKHDLPKL